MHHRDSQRRKAQLHSVTPRGFEQRRVVPIHRQTKTAPLAPRFWPQLGSKLHGRGGQSTLAWHHRQNQAARLQAAAAARHWKMQPSAKHTATR